MFRPAVLIAHYNHGDTLADVVRPLRNAGLNVLVVDDGSSAHAQQKLEELALAFPDVRIERRRKNGGKGAALSAGFEILGKQGFTHALVPDADGQHDTAQAAAFIDSARRQPDALVLGDPIFGDDAPKVRVYGRRISRFWVHVATLSFAIRDPLCGYRCYPLESTRRVLRENVVGMRMDFDPEIAVRLYWAGAPVVNVPTRVIYPKGGISHYRLVRDNARISWMHTRLCFGMIARLPALLLSRPAPGRESSA